MVSFRNISLYNAWIGLYKYFIVKLRILKYSKLNKILRNSWRFRPFVQTYFPWFCVVFREYPRITFEGMKGIQVADFWFLVSEEQGNVSASLSYKLIDVTWDEALKDTTSSLFKKHALPFCLKVFAIFLVNTYLLT